MSTTTDESEPKDEVSKIKNSKINEVNFDVTKGRDSNEVKRVLKSKVKSSALIYDFCVFQNKVKGAFA